VNLEHHFPVQQLQGPSLPPPVPKEEQIWCSSTDIELQHGGKNEEKPHYSIHKRDEDEDDTDMRILLKLVHKKKL
jgi:hypothetical protein